MNNLTLPQAARQANNLVEAHRADDEDMADRILAFLEKYPDTPEASEVLAILALGKQRYEDANIRPSQ